MEKGTVIDFDVIMTLEFKFMGYFPQSYLLPAIVAFRGKAWIPRIDGRAWQKNECKKKMWKYLSVDRIRRAL